MVRARLILSAVSGKYSALCSEKEINPFPAILRSIEEHACAVVAASETIWTKTPDRSYLSRKKWQQSYQALSNNNKLQESF